MVVCELLTFHYVVEVGPHQVGHKIPGDHKGLRSDEQEYSGYYATEDNNSGTVPLHRLQYIRHVDLHFV